jgi:hypothetical protein
LINKSKSGQLAGFFCFWNHEATPGSTALFILSDVSRPLPALVGTVVDVPTKQKKGTPDLWNTFSSDTCLLCFFQLSPEGYSPLLTS